MPLMTRVYDEMVDFIASGATPASVADYRPSEAARQRVGELIEREKSESLTPDESTELNHYLELEHILRLAKARARLRLGRP